jgi:hypothetical protein
VRCWSFKEMLAVSAEALARKLLDQIRATVRASNMRVNDDYTVGAGGAGIRARTWRQ